MSWSHTYFRLSVHVVVALQKQRRRLHVILLRSNVQRRKSHAPSGVVLQQDRHHFIVALLQRDCERRESVLKRGQSGHHVCHQQTGAVD